MRASTLVFSHPPARSQPPKLRRMNLDVENLLGAAMVAGWGWTLIAALGWSLMSDPD